MSRIAFNGNALGTGTFTIASPNSNSDRTMTLSDSSGTIYIAPGDGIQALASGVPTARTITAGTGVTVTNGDGSAGNPTITNSGVTSAVAGTGVSVSGATGAVTITNSGVTSNVAGTGISVSGGTGAVTITNSGVTSIVAGTGISISGGTGAVTVTNTSTGPSTTYGDVGTYVIAAIGLGANTTLAQGNTVSGSSLVYSQDANNGSNYIQTLANLLFRDSGGVTSLDAIGTFTSMGLSGTWRIMGRARASYNGGTQYTVTMFVRVS
jgi:hypothetical protein